MAKVFITGDTHCPNDIHKLNSEFFPQGQSLTKDDIVIICGDAGFVWDGSKNDKWWIDWISKKPWTTVYCDGNHEGHDLLNAYPVINFHGAKAHKITDSLFHILRGEILEINNKKYFFFGGGFSHDIEYRKEFVSWWQNELPVQSEINNAINNLNKVNNKVDFIITHDVPTQINAMLGYNHQDMSKYDNKYVNLASFLQNIYETVTFSKWFAGHYHINQMVDRIQILYQYIAEVKTDDFEFLDTPIYRISNLHFTFNEVKNIAKKHFLFINEFLQLGTATLNGRTVINFSDFLKQYEDTLSSEEKNLLSDNLKNFLLADMKRFGYVTKIVLDIDSKPRKNTQTGC